MGEFKHDLIVHLKDTFSMIAEVDPDRYCHMDMLNDICKCMLGAICGKPNGKKSPMMRATGN